MGKSGFFPKNQIAQGDEYMTNDAVSLISCTFEGCRIRVPEKGACTPIIDAINADRKQNGKAKVSVETLAEHGLCWKHGRMLQKLGVAICPFQRAVAYLQRRGAEHRAATRLAERFKHVPKTPRWKAAPRPQQTAPEGHPLVNLKG